MPPSQTNNLGHSQCQRKSIAIVICMLIVPMRLFAGDLIVPRYESTGNMAFTISLLALGVLLGLLAYTIFLAISTREVMFVYFSIIMLLLTILQTFAAYDRFIFSLTYNRVTVITHLLFITFLLFFEDFFRLAEHAPKLSQVNRISILVIAAYTIFFLISKALLPQAKEFHTLIDFIRELFVFYTNIIFLYTIIVSIRWMKAEGIILLIAFIPPALLTSINAMQIFHFMDRYATFVGFLMTYNQPIGLSLQAILFSLAMGNRYNRIKLERQQSMQERDALQEIDREKTEFFMNMSHELRTPLTIILGMVQQLRQGKFGDSIGSNGRIFATIERNALRLLKQVNHILRMGKIETGSDNLSLPISLTLKLIVDEFSSLAEERGIDCLLEQEQETGHIALAITRDDFETVVMNLLSNALKFTPSGGTVTVSTALSTDKDLTITVSDTGIGISDTDKQSIFTRYYHISGEGNHSQTGLGLALVKTIMENYGGSVAVESTLGKGSRFTLTFPSPMVGQWESSSQQKAVSSGMGKLYTSEFAESAAPEDQSEDPTKPSVLVVDDNIDMCSYIVTILREHYRVLCTYNGKEALDLIDTEVIGLIICDIMMPTMDGHQFLNELKNRSLEHPIPLIFLTARDSVEEKIGSLQEGAVHYITKPFSEEVLLATIERTLAHDRQTIASHIGAMRKRIEEVFEEMEHPQPHGSLRQGKIHIEQFAHEANLSSRELQVLSLILAGKSDKEIAVSLDLSVKTVANHNRRLYQKAQVSSRYELIAKLYGY